MVARNRRLRTLIAMRAARLMAEEGVSNFYVAKRKAAVYYGTPVDLPRNDEVEIALKDYLRLFQAETQPQYLRNLRQTAIRALRFFESFQARLVGSVLEGTANAHSNIDLHLFTDFPEEVALFLEQQSIPFDMTQRELRLSRNGSKAIYPAYSFVAEENVVELIALPLWSLRHAPLSPVDGRPMARATADQVLRLLEKEQEDPKN